MKKRRRRVKLTSKEIRLLYEVNDFSMAKIAEHFGVSRQAIHWHLKRAVKPPAIDRKICEVCKTGYEKIRGPGRPPHHDYCKPACKEIARQRVEDEKLRELAKRVLPGVDLGAA